jgi:hypothetical protein
MHKRELQACRRALSAADLRHIPRFAVASRCSRINLVAHRGFTSFVILF